MSVDGLNLCSHSGWRRNQLFHPQVWLPRARLQPLRTSPVRQACQVKVFQRRLPRAPSKAHKQVLRSRVFGKEVVIVRGSLMHHKLGPFITHDRAAVGDSIASESGRPQSLAPNSELGITDEIDSERSRAHRVIMCTDVCTCVCVSMSACMCVYIE